MQYSRLVYVISDLHIGGAYATGTGPEERGFRMMTHAADLARFITLLSDQPAEKLALELVINGDFLDFLSEPVDAEYPPRWAAFREDQEQACAVFRAIAARDAAIFKALAKLLQAGHSLTVLLGNHDIELSLPRVRSALEESLGVRGHNRFRFLYDNEAYVIGNALIEHGNRYDIYNWVDHDQLRRVRSVQSRCQDPATQDVTFSPVLGSRLVTDVMNPLKARYPFVDLLKPEREAVLPLLRTLMGGYRGQLGSIVSAAQAVAPVVWRRMKHRTQPSERGAIAGREQLSGRVASFLAGFGEPEPHGGRIGNIVQAGRNIALRPAQPADADEVLKKHLPKLLEALQILKEDMTFDDNVETQPAYLHAAEELSSSGELRYVIFGHTHLAKRVQLNTGALYLNSGTWANLMKVPATIFAQNADALRELEDFVRGISSHEHQHWTHYRPTFIRLCVGMENQVSRADLVDFRDAGPFDNLEI